MVQAAPFEARTAAVSRRMPGSRWTGYGIVKSGRVRRIDWLGASQGRFRPFSLGHHRPAIAFLQLSSPSLEKPGTGEKTYLEAAISRVAPRHRCGGCTNPTDACGVEDGLVAVEADKMHRHALRYQAGLGLEMGSSCLPVLCSRCSFQVLGLSRQKPRTTKIQRGNALVHKPKVFLDRTIALRATTVERDLTPDTVAEEQHSARLSDPRQVDVDWVRICPHRNAGPTSGSAQNSASARACTASSDATCRQVAVRQPSGPSLALTIKIPSTDPRILSQPSTIPRTTAKREPSS